MLFRSNDTATIENYTNLNTLSLLDALPISGVHAVDGSGLTRGNRASPFQVASLLQAIVTAEQTAGGKATEAELDDDSRAPVYKVKVVPGDGKTLAVTVDGVSGKVVSSKPAGDHEDDDAPDSN